MAESNCDEDDSDDIIEVVDDDGKPKALTEEELEKKRKLVEQEAPHNKLFAAPPAKKKAKDEEVRMADIMTRTIPLMFVLSTRDRKTKPTHQKFQKLNEMATAGETFALPLEDEMKFVDSLQLEYANHKATTPRPSDFWDRLEMLSERIKNAKPHMIQTLNLIGDAASAYHLACAMEETCLAEDNIQNGKAWNEIVQSLIFIGIPDIIKALTKRKKDEQLKAAAAAAFAKAAAAQATASASVAQPGSSSVTPSSTATTEAVTVMHNGQRKELDTVFAAGTLSKRDRQIVPKKRSAKGKMTATTGKVFKNRVLFKLWLNAGWKEKKRAGADKYHHGLTVTDNADGTLGLYCDHCDKPVGERFGQHLATQNHWTMFEKVKKAIEDAKNGAIPDASRVTAAAVDGEGVEDAYDRLLDECIAELEKKRVNENLAGTTLSTAQTKYRAEVLHYACFANMGMQTLHRFTPAMNLKGPASLVIGYAPDLPRTVGDALWQAQRKKVKWIVSQCFREYGILFDGSPLGANAEAIMGRFINRSNYRVVNVLLSVRLFSASLTGENVASHLISELRSYGLAPEDWRTCMMDRAATNGAALNRVRELDDYSPSNFPCLSHTFNLPGKEFNCPILDKYRKYYNKGIMFRGKMFVMVKAEFGGVTPLISGGVRWYLIWEQIAQMDAMGIKRIATEITEKAEREGLSVASVEKMKTWSKDELLPRLIVQAGAVTEVGRHFCVATYVAEGDDPLVFTIWSVFDDLDNYVHGEVYFDDDGLTRRRCQEAAELIGWDGAVEEYNVAHEEEQRIRLGVAEVEAELAQFDVLANEQVELEDNEQQVDEEEQNLGRGRRVRRANQRYEDSESESEEDDASDEGGVELLARQEIEDRIAAESIELESAKKAAEELQIGLVELQKKYEGVMTEEDLMAHAIKCVKTAIDKYTKLFRDDAHLCRVRRACRACKLFDVLFLLETQPSLDTLYRMVDELPQLGLKEFTPAFIAELKTEIPALLNLVQGMQYNFEGEDAVKEEERYVERTKMKLRRSRQRATLINIDNALRQQQNADADLGGDDGAEDGAMVNDIEQALDDAAEEVEGEIDEGNFRRMNWKKDVGERARRVYEWWTTAMLERGDTVPCCFKAVRIIALAQTSSAAVERVFSQLTFIRRAVGDNTLRQMMELRALIRCNSGLEDDFKITL